jgi:hypothetical protein
MQMHYDLAALSLLTPERDTFRDLVGSSKHCPINIGQHLPRHFRILNGSRLQPFSQSIDRHVTGRGIEMSVGFQEILEVEEDVITSFLDCLLLGFSNERHCRNDDRVRVLLVPSASCRCAIAFKGF